MKTTLYALVALISGVAATVARAENRAYVGVNFANGSDFRSSVRPYCPPVVAPAPVRFYAPAAARRGYWKDVTVRTWIPDRWTMSHNRWGRPIRILERGHFALVTNRVWVDGRHDRRFSPGNYRR